MRNVTVGAAVRGGKEYAPEEMEKNAGEHENELEPDDQGWWRYSDAIDGVVARQMRMKTAAMHKCRCHHHLGAHAHLHPRLRRHPSNLWYHHRFYVDMIGDMTDKNGGDVTEEWR